jgi:oxaloacetate decarboxylase gamma subunit
MTIAEMLGQSGILTLLGMGVVFGFLFILVLSVTATGKVIHALGLDREAAPPPKSAAPEPAAGDAVTAAISAAVSAYRKNH